MRQGEPPRGVRVSRRGQLEVRQIAMRVREKLGLYDPYVDMMRLLEHRLHVLGVDFDVRDEDEMGGDEACTLPDRNEIRIRLDVYNALEVGNRRARFTVAHELGHLVLHPGIVLARSLRIGTHSFDEDSESQADGFAAEFLMPVDLVVARRCRTAAQVSEMFAVSMDAALIRVKALRTEGLLRR
jgi:Zn-dependent peptidase ImmA (M78 family)